MCAALAASAGRKKNGIRRRIFCHRAVIIAEKWNNSTGKKNVFIHTGYCSWLTRPPLLSSRTASLSKKAERDAGSSINGSAGFHPRALTKRIFMHEPPIPSFPFIFNIAVFARVHTHIFKMLEVIRFIANTMIHKTWLPQYSLAVFS